MGIFDKMKGLVMEEDGAKPAPQAAPAPQGSAPPYRQPPPPAPGVNQEMVAAIRKGTFSKNTALTALITASDALAEIIPDPVMRLKAAQKTAGAGRGAKEFADAVAIHLSDVDGAEMLFNQQLKQSSETQLRTLNSQISVKENAMTTGASRIQQLTQEIADIQQRMAADSTEQVQLKQTLAETEQGFNTTKAEFAVAAQTVRDELNSHKNTILSTLG